MATLSRIGFAFMVASLMSACGGPVLQNVPAPNKAVVAGAAAATAAAVTLADPDFAAANANREREAFAREPREPDGSKESAPADVLDRLDAAERQAKEPGYGAPSRSAPVAPEPSAAPASPFFPAPGAPGQQPAKKSPYTSRWGYGTVPVVHVPKK